MPKCLRQSGQESWSPPYLALKSPSRNKCSQSGILPTADEMMSCLPRLKSPMNLKHLVLRRQRSAFAPSPGSRSSSRMKSLGIGLGCQELLETQAVGEHFKDSERFSSLPPQAMITMCFIVFSKDCTIQQLIHIILPALYLRNYWGSH